MSHSLLQAQLMGIIFNGRFSFHLLLFILFAILLQFWSTEKLNAFLYTCTKFYFCKLIQFSRSCIKNRPVSLPLCMNWCCLIQNIYFNRICENRFSYEKNRIFSFVHVYPTNTIRPEDLEILSLLLTTFLLSLHAHLRFFLNEREQFSRVIKYRLKLL